MKLLFSAYLQVIIEKQTPTHAFCSSVFHSSYRPTYYTRPAYHKWACKLVATRVYNGRRGVYHRNIRKEKLEILLLTTSVKL